jgi:hypothetical protein
MALEFALGCKWAAAQGDSAFVTSTIHVSKPELIAHVEVSEEYAVFLKTSDAPKLGHISHSKQKYIKSKDLRSYGQNEENPEPVLGTALKKKNGIIAQKIEGDSIGYTLRDSITDLSNYLSTHIRYFFKDKYTHNTDTLQLKIAIDKKGKYIYHFASRADSLNEAAPKCMQALTEIKKWKPAHVGRVNDRKRTKTKKAYSEILVTIILSTENGNTAEESAGQ